MQALEDYGRPAFLVVPNDHHRLDAKIWKERYPLMQVVAPEGSRAKVEEAVHVDTTDPGFGDPNEHFQLRLYVAGQTPKSVRAYENLKKICEEHLADRYTIELIDLMKNPQLAKGDEIVAIPTLVRQLPHPIRKIIGDLSNTERALVGLQIKPA